MWQPNEHRGAQVVNEHRSVNFNDLNTRDVEAAKSFYGGVFGWQALAMEGGFEMWALPGYGDFLDEINPGTKANMAEMGAPEGFVDVIASIAPIPDDQPDTPIGGSRSESTTRMRQPRRQRHSAARSSRRRWTCRGSA